MIVRLLLLISLLTLVMTATAPAASVPRADRRFLIETAQGARFEIKLGRIAKSKGHTREARAAGATMVRDHSGELHAVAAVAKSLGVKLPSGPSTTQQHAIAKTQGHTGVAFDRAYARLEVGDHIRDLKSADSEAREGRVASVRALAQKYRLMYQRHLAIFRALARHVRAG